MKFVLILIFIALNHLQKTENLQFNFNKVLCNSTDETFIKTEKCILKAVSRNEQYITINVKFLKTNLSHAKIRFEFMRRANGWKPFLYDITIRCDSSKKADPLNKLLWSWLNDLTNLNNSCPSNQNVEIKNLTNSYVSSKALKGLPIPKGTYRLLNHWIVGGKELFLLEITGTFA